MIWKFSIVRGSAFISDVSIVLSDPICLSSPTPMSLSLFLLFLFWMRVMRLLMGWVGKKEYRQRERESERARERVFDRREKESLRESQRGRKRQDTLRVMSEGGRQADRAIYAAFCVGE